MNDKLQKIRKEVIGDKYIVSSLKIHVLYPPKKLSMKSIR